MRFHTVKINAPDVNRSRGQQNPLLIPCYSTTAQLLSPQYCLRYTVVFCLKLNNGKYVDPVHVLPDTCNFMSCSQPTRKKQHEMAYQTLARELSARRHRGRARLTARLIEAPTSRSSDSDASSRSDQRAPAWAPS